MADKKMTQLADPQAAIASYLDDLLHIATDQALQQDTEAQVIAAKPLVAIAPAPSPAKPAAVVVEPLVQAVAAVQLTPTAGPQAKPEWAEKPFECLIFTVAGLQLAVPLVLLGAIHRIEEDIIPMPGSPPWYMGIRSGQNKNLRVVDSAEWIMAGRAPANARANYRFVIHLNNSDWGLACDNVAQSFTLSPQQVRWRTSRSKRPWLAGTVIEQMCALLDVQSMANLLARAEREQHLDLS
ncbi:MAG: chemotaxis protein CheW [Marinobacter sp.]